MGKLTGLFLLGSAALVMPATTAWGGQLTSSAGTSTSIADTARPRATASSGGSGSSSGSASGTSGGQGTSNPPQDPQPAPQPQPSDPASTSGTGRTDRPTDATPTPSPGSAATPAAFAGAQSSLVSQPRDVRANHGTVSTRAFAVLVPTEAPQPLPTDDDSALNATAASDATATVEASTPSILLSAAPAQPASTISINRPSNTSQGVMVVIGAGIMLVLVAGLRLRRSVLGR